MNVQNGQGTASLESRGIVASPCVSIPHENAFDPRISLAGMEIRMLPIIAYRFFEPKTRGGGAQG